MNLNFGQPDDGIMQMAYVVPDIGAAMQSWVDNLGVGPWFLLESFTGDDPIYRGEPARGSAKLAMSFAGHMNVELIQPNDDHPSVYKEHIAGRVPGHQRCASRLPRAHRDRRVDGGGFHRVLEVDDRLGRHRSRSTVRLRRRHRHESPIT